MKPLFTLLPFALFACANPTITESTLDKDVESDESTSPEDTLEETTPEDSNSSDDSDTSGNSDDSPDETGSDNGQNGGSSTYVLESNTWYVTEAVMIEDTCDWDSALRQFFGIGSESLLPESFSVDGFDGSFNIEANEYGASGPISCGFSGASFECETQSVTPLAFDLGTYGWTYAIDFSGAANDETSISGIAEVTFPTVSDWLIPIFQSSGVDVSQCVQTFELSISVD